MTIQHRSLPLSLSLVTFILSLTLLAPAQELKPKSLEERAKELGQLYKTCWAKKDYAPAVKAIENFINSGDAKALNAESEVAYGLACGYALMGQPDTAFKWLDTAVSKGFKSFIRMENDSDLASLHSDPHFTALLTRVRPVDNYLSILQNYAAFSTVELTDPPRFTYQTSETPELQTLRRTYELDKVAGTGDELSKIKNLMHWVHRQVRHDGKKENPWPMNALHLLEVCAKEKRTVNCRGMATILNEVYLSMGFPSRHITCLPKDTTDMDCHVVNIVYARSLDRWVMMDPTFEAYVMDEKGQILGLEEFRDRLICGKKLTLNPEINWNGEESRDPGTHLDYMAKNLFHFECPLESVFGFESHTGVRPYVKLEPAKVILDQPSGHDGSRRIIKIQNAAAFWDAPTTETDSTH